MATEVAGNYLSWQNAGWDWYAELQFRRRHMSLYDRQEAYLREFFSRRAAEFLSSAGRSLRVLEFGCGFGRHLKHLHQTDGIEVYGCDQSPAMLRVGRALLLGRFPELEGKLVQVDPNDRLPYEDGAFDVVYTVSVLIHCRPEDVLDRVRELHRVCSGTVLNVELPPAPHSFLWDEAHDGCWLHDFAGLHREVGPCAVTVDADALGPRATVYVAEPSEEGSTRVLLQGQWHEGQEEVRRAMLETTLEYAKACRGQAQENFGREAELSTRLATTNARFRGVNQELCQERTELRGALAARTRQLQRLQATRSIRLANWLGRHRVLRGVLVGAADCVSRLRRLAGGRAEAPATRAASADDAGGPGGDSNDQDGP
jgi:SAM-dependent methyltransferase